VESEPYIQTQIPSYTCRYVESEPYIQAQIPLIFQI